MAGTEDFEEIEDFGKTHEGWLKQYLILKNGILSHDTSRGEFLKLFFLSWIGLFQKLSVDHYHVQIEEMRFICERMGIPYEGFLFEGRYLYF